MGAKDGQQHNRPSNRLSEQCQGSCEEGKGGWGAFGRGVGWVCVCVWLRLLLFLDGATGQVMSWEGVHLVGRRPPLPSQ